jgi:EmrB/QacA subfamily drug resistance transporter
MSAGTDTIDTLPPTTGRLERGGPDGGSDRSRWLALYVLCVGMLMIVLDVTIVNVALPSIQEDLRFSTSSLAWVVNAYLIAFGGLLLLAGRLGDLIGRRRIFLAGVALFTSASLLCGIAQTAWWLVAARFVQGVGGAMTSAVILGMIVTMFTDAREQAKAIGVFAFVASAGGSVGLLAGGVLTQSINWHWIFFVNLPIGIATALAARRLVPDEPGIGLREGADVPGATLITSALMLGVYTIVGPAAKQGWGSASTLLFGAGSIALMVSFLARETRAASPLMPLRIFRSRPVAAANAIQILSVAGMFGMFFLGALYLRRVLGYDALQIGLAFLPVTIAMGTLSIRYSERIFMALGARRALLAGLTLVLAGLVVFALAPVHADYPTQVAPSMLLLGLGAGTAFPALMNLAMSGATPQDAGLASGLVNTTAQVGGALGLAVLATLSTSRSNALTASGHPIAAALTTGYHLAFWVAAALVGCALVVVLAAVDSGRALPGARGAAEVHGDTDAHGQRHAQPETHAHGNPSAEGARAALGNAMIVDFLTNDPVPTMAPIRRT